MEVDKNKRDRGKLIRAIVLVPVILFLFWYWARTFKVEEKKSIWNYAPPPDFYMSGKPILLVFVAADCTPCDDEIKHLVKFHDEFKEKVKIVLALLESEDVDTFARRYGIQFQIIPGANDFAKRMGVKSLPTNFIIRRNGVVEKRIPESLTFKMMAKEFGEVVP